MADQCFPQDYELQLVTYKAQLEPVASPAKKPKVQSGSESVIQEYVDLRARYSELTTLTSQYIKFISETLRRMEEEEVRLPGLRVGGCPAQAQPGNLSDHLAQPSPPLLPDAPTAPPAPPRPGATLLSSLGWLAPAPDEP